MKKLLALFTLTLLITSPIFAQWSYSGSNIYNNNAGNVLVGSSSFAGFYTSDQKVLQIRGANQSWLGLRPTGATPWFEIGAGTASGGSVLYAHSGTLKLWADGTRMTINNTNGFVGIGTSTPSELLHINGNIRGPISGAIRISTGYGYVDVGPMNTGWSHFQTDRPRYYFNVPITVDGGLVGSYDEDLALQTQGTSRLTISNSTGNIGINTSPTTHRLDVNGTINATGLYVNGAPLTGGGPQSIFDLNPGYGNGMRFWSSDLYKIHMGNSAEYHYGPVTDYSIKMNMSNTAGRGWTWGVAGATPVAALNTQGNMKIAGSMEASSFLVNGVPIGGGGGTSQWTTSGANIHYNTGSVGIGTTLTSNPNNYKLAVNGTIGSKEVKVETSSSTWPDYVFKNNYKLNSIEEVERFIAENGHLPDVPTAKEIEEKGQALGEMNTILLKKIEELTLYVIELKKEVDELKQK